MYTAGTGNCGVKEISEVQGKGSAKEKLYNLLSELDGPPRAAFLIFSGACSKPQEHKATRELAAYIRSEGLGSVNCTKPVKNPNTRNYITLYVWTVDSSALLKWFQDERKRRYSDD